MTELRTDDRDAGRPGRPDRPVPPVVPETAGREAARARARGFTSLISRNAAIVVLFVVVIIGFIGVPTFGSADNLRNVALAASSIGIIAAGMTFVIISGGIDLSVGSTYALAVITSAYFAQSGSLVAVVGALACAAAVGLVQGLIISYLRLPPFIVTLAGLTAVRGLVYFITDEGNNHPLVPKGRSFEVFGTGELATVKMPVWIMLVIFALGWFLLNRTAFGQTAQAVGDSEAAAGLMGLAVRRTTTLVYVLSSLCAGLAGVLTTALSGGGQEARIGDSYELQAIAAVVIGGTLLAGGVGSLIGTLAGVGLLFVIQNLIVQGANLNSYVQQVVSGGFLLVVVVLQATLARRSNANTG